MQQLINLIPISNEWQKQWIITKYSYHQPDVCLRLPCLGSEVNNFVRYTAGISPTFQVCVCVCVFSTLLVIKSACIMQQYKLTISWVRLTLHCPIFLTVIFHQSLGKLEHLPLSNPHPWPPWVLFYHCLYELSAQQFNTVHVKAAVNGLFGAFAIALKSFYTTKELLYKCVLCILLERGGSECHLGDFVYN